MENRAALSLYFERDDVYYNLVKPLKTGKQLSSLVIKLVEAYYDDETVRNIIDNDGLSSREEIDSKYDDYFKDISALISVMGNITDDIGETVKSGLQGIIDDSEVRDDIDEDVWGVSVPKVSNSLENLKTENKMKFTEVTNDELDEEKEDSVLQITEYNKRLDKLEENMEFIIKLLQNKDTIFASNEANNIKSEINDLNSITTENINFTEDIIEEVDENLSIPNEDNYTYDNEITEEVYNKEIITQEVEDLEKVVEEEKPVEKKSGLKKLVGSLNMA